MKTRGAIVILLIGASFSLAHAGDPPRVAKLLRPEPAAGDSYRVEMTSKIVQITPGTKTKETVESRAAYVCSILSKTATGKFETKLALEPEELRVTAEDGTVHVEKSPAKTITMEMSEDETRVIPSKGMAQATGADVLVGRAQVTLGETWTADKKFPVGSVCDVPVHSTYKVTSIDRDAEGRDLVRIDLRSEGVGTVPTTGVRMRVFGAGHLVVDAARSDRPVELKLAYRFVAEGGPGQDAETRSEITVKTQPVKPAKETTK